MRNRFHVTYDIVTHESAERGDVDSRGFVDAGGWSHDMTNAPCGPAFAPIKAQYAMRLVDALSLIGVLDSGSDGLTYYEADGRTNYRTGDVTRYAFHLPDNVTQSSIRRIARLLKSKRLV